MTNKRSNVFLSWGASILALFFLSVFIRVPVFAFTTDDQLYWTTDREFDLSWIHSVEKEEWIEHYQHKDGQLWLSDTSFKTFGAGVPSSGAKTELKDGYVRMAVDLTYPSLRLAVSENVHSTLILSDHTLHLYEFVDDYDTVTIEPQRFSIWDFFFKGEKL